MSNSIYTSLTGLMAYSNGLNNLSSNVANMNTNGYKKNDLLFQDMVYHYKYSTSDISGSTLKIGTGVRSDASHINFAQGEVRETGNDLDVAIDGNGFFIIKDSDNNYFYTRNGGFEFGPEGYLVLKSTQLRVQAVNNSGVLSDINISDYYSDPASPTTSVSFSGNLSSSATTYTINDVIVYDSIGESHNLSITLTRDLSLIRTWNITINDEDGNVVASGGSIQFQGNGSPEVDQNLFTFDFTPEDMPTQTITINFGEPGSFDGVTNFAGTSELVFKEQDGYAAGGLTSTTFDSSGRLKLIYSNGNEYNNKRLGLANFANMAALKPAGNSLFISTDNRAVIIGYAKTNGIGELISKSIELSNVELTEQFTDMVIIQRGYQASSQVLTATNEMIQQLIEATRSR